MDTSANLRNLQRIIALTAGRIFVRKDLSRDPELLECGMTFTIDLAKGGWEMRRRSLLQKVWAHYTDTIPESQNPALARPRPPSNHPYHQRTPVQDGSRHQVHPAQRLHNIEHARGRETGYPSSVEHQSRFQLEVFLAAIYFNTIPITHILYDLLTYPSYIAPLRAEISAVRNHETNSARHLISRKSTSTNSPQTQFVPERVPARLNPSPPHRHRPRRPRSRRPNIL